MERIPKVGEKWVFKFDRNEWTIIKEVTKQFVMYDKQYRYMNRVYPMYNSTLPISDFIHWFEPEEESDEMENF